MNRHPNTDKNRNEPQVELESQFIMRLPPVCFSYCYFIQSELNLIRDYLELRIKDYIYQF